MRRGYGRYVERGCGNIVWRVPAKSLEELSGSLFGCSATNQSISKKNVSHGRLPAASKLLQGFWSLSGHTVVVNLLLAMSTSPSRLAPK